MEKINDRAERILSRAKELLAKKEDGVEYTWEMTKSSFENIINYSQDVNVSHIAYNKYTIMTDATLFDIPIDIIRDDLVSTPYNNIYIGLIRKQPNETDYTDYTAYSNLAGETNMIKNGIENVIYNGPATIVFWKDGTKTVVKCCKGDTFNQEKGLAMAIIKRLCGNDNSYHKIFKEWTIEEEESVSSLYGTIHTPYNYFMDGIEEMLNVIRNVANRAPKEMTLEEIEKELGHAVKIVEKKDIKDDGSRE